jgi:hypothetical protein
MKLYVSGSKLIEIIEQETETTSWQQLEKNLGLPSGGLNKYKTGEHKHFDFYRADDVLCKLDLQHRLNELSVYYKSHNGKTKLPDLVVAELEEELQRLKRVLDNERKRAQVWKHRAVYKGWCGADSKARPDLALPMGNPNSH